MCLCDYFRLIVDASDILPFTLVKYPVKSKGDVISTSNRDRTKVHLKKIGNMSGKSHPILIHHVDKDLKQVDFTSQEEEYQDHDKGDGIHNDKKE